MCEVSVNFALLVKRNLQVLRFFERLLNLVGLDLCLVQTVDQAVVLEDVTSRVSEFSQKLLFVVSKLDLQALFFLKEFGLTCF